MAVVFVFPAHSSYLGWNIFDEIIYAPIPRILWPDKPKTTRNLLNIVEHYVPRANSPVIWSPYYAGFGVIGVVLCMFVWGVFLFMDLFSNS